MFIIFKLLNQVAREISDTMNNIPNRPFSKMAAENLNKLKLKTYTSIRKYTFTLVTLQSFRISGVISAEKM